MKTTLVALFAILFVLATGCSSDKAVNTNDEAALNFDVIGTDAPTSAEAALQELADNSIVVPNPVADDDELLNSDFSPEAVNDAFDGVTLDEDGRAQFRRILVHLNDQMHALRRCMANNDDPRLRRLGNGAAQAIRHGLRALHSGQPRLALEQFHLANRALNAAREICSERG
ncbi:MAG: hypothetical protein KDB65_11000 [Calditrichaeota bacterium]|nr:hypothetical protein [Calditrichota bacterium]